MEFRPSKLNQVVGKQNKKNNITDTNKKQLLINLEKMKVIKVPVLPVFVNFFKRG